jgi:hypothetical protein
LEVRFLAINKKNNCWYIYNICEGLTYDKRFVKKKPMISVKDILVYKKNDKFGFYSDLA